jgi:hypothetical protein
MTDSATTVDDLVRALEVLPPSLKAEVGRRLLGIPDDTSIPPPPRWCYMIMVGQTSQGQYVPSVVVENEPGHAPLSGNGPLSEPWRWGADYDKAREIARQANHEMGLSDEDVLDIVTSSMRASNVEDARRNEVLAKLDGHR